MTEQDRGECRWSVSTAVDDGSVWQPACLSDAGLYQFNEGGPLSNAFAFCPYCGGILVEVAPVIEGDA